MNKKELKGLLPDESDRANIAELLGVYDRKFPYPHPESIGRVIEDAKEEISNTGPSKDGMVLRFVMPEKLAQLISVSYPTLFTDKVQKEWFLENFRVFDLTK